MHLNHVKEAGRVLPVLGFAGILFGLSVVGIFGGEKAYSAFEKRELQTMPELTAQAVKNGSFQEDYETYLADQIPGRDDWVQLQTYTSRMLGKTKINGVYFAKDHYLLEAYDASDFPDKQVSKALAALTDFVSSARERSSVRVLFVPTKTWAMRDLLPAFAVSYDEERFFDALERSFEESFGEEAQELLVSMDVLAEHTDEQIYYRSDHHWTGLGAWYGYMAYMDSLGGHTDQALEKRPDTLVTEHFYGTSYAKVHQGQADSIYTYVPQAQLRVTYNMGEKTADSLFDASYLDTEDAYSYFTGGNQALLEISGGAENGKTLLIVKDSFANCMLPYLAEDYEYVVVADPRQLNVRGKMLLDMYEPTDVLVLYNSAQFVKEYDTYFWDDV